MTTQGNGQPIRYKVQMSGLVRERVRELHQQAAARGIGPQFVAAFRELVKRGMRPEGPTGARRIAANSRRW